MDRLRRRTGFSVALMATALLTGCAGSSPASAGPTIAPSASTASAEPPARQSIGRIVITESDCTFQPADELQPGAAQLAATNNSDDWAGVHMWRIVEGHTYEELAAHVAEEVRLAEAGEPGLGHPDFLADLIEVVVETPGQAATGTGTLKAATYGFVCARMSKSAGEPRPFTTIGPLEVR